MFSFMYVTSLFWLMPRMLTRAYLQDVSIQTSSSNRILTAVWLMATSVTCNNVTHRTKKLKRIPTSQHSSPSLQQCQWMNCWTFWHETFEHILSLIQRCTCLYQHILFSTYICSLVVWKLKSIFFSPSNFQNSQTWPVYLNITGVNDLVYGICWLMADITACNKLKCRNGYYH